MWRSGELDRGQTLELVVTFEVANKRHLSLVSLMSFPSPGVCHVDESHSFQTEKLPIVAAMELPFEYRAHCTIFTDEGAPVSNVRETEALLIS